MSENVSVINSPTVNVGNIVQVQIVGSSVRVTSDQNNTANVAKSTTLTLNLLANTNYFFEAAVYFTLAAAATIQFQIANLAAGANLVWVGDNKVNSTDIVTATATNIFAAANGNTPAFNVFWGLVTVGANPTTLELDFLDHAAVGTATVKAGSWMTASAVA